MTEKSMNIRIFRNDEETGYEVFIGKNRAGAEQEYGVLYAIRDELKNKLPVKDRIIWI